MKQLSIIGHIGQDAVTKSVNGNEFVEFSVAINEKYKKTDGTEVESTTWFSCSTKKLNLAAHLKRGDKVFVQGNFRMNTYQDKVGVWQTGINLRANNIQLLSPKKDEEKELGLDFLRKLIQSEINNASN